MIMKTKMTGCQASDERRPRALPGLVAERSFRRGDIPAARQFTRAFWARVGLSPARLTDFVLAVSEAVAAATAYGPGAARLRLWMSGTRAFCEVRSGGMVSRQASSGRRRRGDETAALRHSVLQQLADYVSVASGPDGEWVLLSMTVS